MWPPDCDKETMIRFLGVLVTDTQAKDHSCCSAADMLQRYILMAFFVSMFTLWRVQLTDLIVRDRFNNIEISRSGSLLRLACLNLSCLLYEELYSLPEREHPDEDNVPSGKGKWRISRLCGEHNKLVCWDWLLGWWVTSVCCSDVAS